MSKVTTITFFVPGVPKPGGSKKHVGHGRIIDTCKTVMDWRGSVQTFITRALDDLKHADREMFPLSGPVSLDVLFYMPRPKGHFKGGERERGLKDSAPVFHTSAPDTTKLMRSTEDALKCIAWDDDSQVVMQVGMKFYGMKSGAKITISQVNPKLCKRC